MNKSEFIQLTPTKESPTSFCPLLLSIHYRVKNDCGGIFSNGTGPHPFIYSWNALDGYHIESNFGTGTRTWIPCVDDAYERCLWNLYYNVPSPYTLYSCGDLRQKVYRMSRIPDE